MQIAVETERASDMPRLLAQLQILNANDSSIRVFEMVGLRPAHDLENGGAHHQCGGGATAGSDHQRPPEASAGLEFGGFAADYQYSGSVCAVARVGGGKRASFAALCVDSEPILDEGRAWSWRQSEDARAAAARGAVRASVPREQADVDLSERREWRKTVRVGQESE